VRYECNIAYRRQLYAFCSLFLKLKQIHNLKNRVFPHVISDYKENPRPTFFVNSLQILRHRYFMCEKFKKNWPF
jgi:hypothetical protein